MFTTGIADQKVALTSRRIRISLLQTLSDAAMDHRRNMIGPWTVRILCALSLLFVGFAHQPPALAGEPENFEAYRLPDGSLPTLCITVSNDDEGKGSTRHKIHHQGCEACRVSASVLLPTPADTAGSRFAYRHRVVLPQRTEAFRRQIYPPNTRPRAPPSLPIMT